MAENLQWIRFWNGTEKQVPKHIALDPTVQKAQNFEPISKQGGTPLQPSEAPVPQKKMLRRLLMSLLHGDKVYITIK